MVRDQDPAPRAPARSSRSWCDPRPSGRRSRTGACLTVMLAVAVVALGFPRGLPASDGTSPLPPPPPAGPAEPLCILGSDMRVHRFKVEIADDDLTRQRGLMFRRELARDRGMLFWYGSERPVRMWMKNTFIPLDMLFIDRAGRVVSIAERTEPRSERIIHSGRLASAVLELSAGEVAARRLAVGNRVLHRYFEEPCP